MAYKRRGARLLSTLLLVSATPCVAQMPAADQRRYDLPRQDLKYALRSVTRSAGLELYAQSDDLRGRQSPEIHAALSPQEVLDRLLSGTNLEADIEGKAVVIRGRVLASSSPTTEERSPTADIVVTGSHIRGAAIASPTITLSAKAIREAGQTSIGEAVRDLPQNFSGGQNPGIIGEGDQRGDNLNSSSTINLRGLGPDATLTLINGHRVAYTGGIQGVDIDQIPLAALDRIEIVADGASAVYGSDAVGGVANILLKRDYEGATASARIGGATDGGDLQQQYDLTSGARWESGGFLAAASVRRNTTIRGSQRSITEDLGPDLILFPAIHQYGGVLAGHQDLGPRLHFEFDASYDHRATGSSFPTGPDHVVTIDGSISRTHEQSVNISPRITYDISSRWHATLSGTYGTDHSAGAISAYSGGELFDQGRYGYRNRTVIAELNADGPLFALPGGDAQLAVGVGSRRNHLLATNQAEYFGVAQDPTRVPGHQQSYYGYAELDLPFVSASNAVWGIDSLSASAAVRYEDYPGLDRLATPKLGLIYSPIEDLTLKASWGKSFKTPTLYQQHQLLSATLIPSDFFGDGAPAGSNSLFLSGGNPDLKPERATSWSATLDVHPRQLAGFRAELSAFHIDYRDRVADPIESLAGLFGDPIYQDLIDRTPSLAVLSAIPQEAGSGFSNFTGAPYDPATVYALIDDRNLNSARERIHGLDLSLDYKSKLGEDQSIAISADGSHLVSNRKLSPLQPSLPLAGTIFHAPHWRGHASIVWTWKSLTLASDVTYTGGVDDDRQPPESRVRGMAPVDLTATYRLATAHSAIRSLDFTLAVRNVQDVMPARIVNDNLYDPTFDSNNYSAIGRTIDFTLSASF